MVITSDNQMQAHPQQRVAQLLVPIDEPAPRTQHWQTPPDFEPTAPVLEPGLMTMTAPPPPREDPMVGMISGNYGQGGYQHYPQQPQYHHHQPPPAYPAPQQYAPQQPQAMPQQPQVIHTNGAPRNHRMTQQPPQMMSSAHQQPQHHQPQHQQPQHHQPQHHQPQQQGVLFNPFDGNPYSSGVSSSAGDDARESLYPTISYPRLESASSYYGQQQPQQMMSHNMALSRPKASKPVVMVEDDAMRKAIQEDVQGHYDQSLKDGNYESWKSILEQANGMNLTLELKKPKARKMLNQKLTEAIQTRDFNELPKILKIRKQYKLGDLKIADAAVVQTVGGEVLGILANENVTFVGECRVEVFRYLAEQGNHDRIMKLFGNLNIRLMWPLIVEASQSGRLDILMNLIQQCSFDRMLFSYLICFLLAGESPVTSEVYQILIQQAEPNYVYGGWKNGKVSTDVSFQNTVTIEDDKGDSESESDDDEEEVKPKGRGKGKKPPPKQVNYQYLPEEKHVAFMGRSLLNLSIYEGKRHPVLVDGLLSYPNLDVNYSGQNNEHLLFSLLKIRRMDSFEQIITSRPDALVSWNRNALVKFAYEQANKRAIDLVRAHPNFIDPKEMDDVLGSTSQKSSTKKK